MTDIVDRLRGIVRRPLGANPLDLLHEEAADEIERLRAFGCEVISLVAAARREGIEAALAAARSVVSPCDDMQRHVAADEIVAAIRALLEDKP